MASFSIVKHLNVVEQIGPGQLGEQAILPLGQSQKSDTVVRGDLAAGKIKFDPALPTGWKFNLRRGTICHRWSLR